MDKKEALRFGFSCSIEKESIICGNWNKFHTRTYQQIVDDKNIRFAYYNAHKEKKPSGEWQVIVTPEDGTELPDIVQENVLYSGYIKSYRPFSKCISFDEITKYCLEVVLKITDTEFVYRFYSDRIQEDELLSRLVKKHKIKTNKNKLKLSDLIGLKIKAKIKKFNKKVYISEII